jgi:hypothetical protein
MDGMVNTCELSINVVMSDKPKMLLGLSQKALERVQSLDNTLSWTSNAPGGQRAPNPSVSTLRNVVSPYCSSTRGREAARPTDSGAGKGVGKSEGRPVMGWIRVAPDLGNITRRASGQTSLRCLGTRTREESIQKVLQMTVVSYHWCYLPREGIDFSVVSCSQQVV